MSLEAVAWALRQPVPDAVGKLLLISIADHHNASTGACFPGRARLAEAGCCDPSTVKRKLSWLAKHGWIRVEPRFAENGRQTSNAYFLNMGGAHSEPGRGAEGAPRGAQSCEPPITLNGNINLSAPVSAKRWKDRLAMYAQRQRWPENWGPMPGQPGCEVPRELLKGFANV